MRSSKPIALQVHPNGDMTVVEVKPGIVAAAVCGPHVETITSGHGVTLWFNRVEQYRRGVNMMGTLHRMPQLGCRPARFRFYTVPSSSPGLPKQPIAPCPGIGKAT